MPKKDLNPEQIETLVLAAQSGETDAFAKIYDHFVEQVYKYVFFKVDKTEALDLTENIFLKVWEKLGSYQKTADSHFSSWLFRIAHNVVVDHYRTRRENVSLEDADLMDEKRHNDPIFRTERKINQDQLRRAIGKLNKKYQQVILLLYVNEMDNSEAAKVMKKSEGSLRILKFRALKALKQVLEEMNYHY